MTKIRPQLLWLATALLTLAIGDRSAILTALVAAVAVAIVLTGPGATTASRLALSLSYLPAAFAAEAPTVAWVAAGVLMSLATTVSRPVDAGESSLLRHLERARRRGEPASVMVLRVPTQGRRAMHDLQRRLRAADSVRTVRGVASSEIQAVMDGGDVEVEAVEARLRADEISGASVGWAHFPRDGGSLDVLVATARERASESSTAGPAGAKDRPAAMLTPTIVKADYR